MPSHTLAAAPFSRRPRHHNASRHAQKDMKHKNAILLLCLITVIVTTAAAISGQPRPTARAADAEFQQQWKEVRARYPRVAEAYKLIEGVALIEATAQKTPASASTGLFCRHLAASGSLLASLICAPVTTPPPQSCSTQLIECFQKGPRQGESADWATVASPGITTASPARVRNPYGKHVLLTWHP